MTSLSYIIHRGCQVHISSIDSEAQALLSPCESIHLFYSFLRLWYSFLKPSFQKEQFTLSPILSLWVPSYNNISLKSGFYPYHHTEPRLAKVNVFQFTIFNKPFTSLTSQDSQCCWLLLSSQKCLIDILKDTPLLVSLCLIIVSVFFCWLHSLLPAKVQ